MKPSTEWLLRIALGLGVLYYGYLGAQVSVLRWLQAEQRAAACEQAKKGPGG